MTEVRLHVLLANTFAMAVLQVLLDAKQTVLHVLVQTEAQLQLALVMMGFTMAARPIVQLAAINVKLVHYLQVLAGLAMVKIEVLHLLVAAPMDFSITG